MYVSTQKVLETATLITLAVGLNMHHVSKTIFCSNKHVSVKNMQIL